MTATFIVTAYNVAPYLKQCLESVLDCARAEDQIIVVDDCSTDESADVARQALKGRRAGRKKIIALGAQTPGGVGIPANIALKHATGDLVFFVDGDDWLHPSAFKAARQTFEASADDILIARYEERDTESGAPRWPSDEGFWQDIPEDRAVDDPKTTALSLNAVPWRKFYRRSFLERHALRFPEGPHFFEDNPFHWDVCLAAQKIGFSRAVICAHRINRSGQTMARRGTELFAFFDHFEEILRIIARHDTGKWQRQAAIWLMTNMAWHIDLLQPDLRPSYAVAANEALKRLPPEVWRTACTAFSPQPVTAAVQLALESGATGFLSAVSAVTQARETAARLDALNAELQTLQNRVEAAEREAHAAHLQAMAQSNLVLFDALQARKRDAT